MNWMITLALVFGCLCSSPGAQTGATRYAAALATEKGEGDPDRAAALYRDLLEQYRTGQANAALAARARERLAILGFQIADSREIPLPFQALGERLGMTSADRLTAAPLPVGDLQVAGLPLRPRYFRRERESDPGHAADPDVGSFIYRVEQQIRALRHALGITGLLEYVEEVAQHSRTPRVPGVYELYQRGMFAERQEGNLAHAAALYGQALAAPFIPAPLHHQLTLRLMECRERLEHRGGQH